MNEQEEKICVNCQRTEEQTPLIALAFKGEAYFICGQCLPLLIHKTHVLADKFPGIELTQTDGH
ncbi:MAG TPA: hypothetical protein PKL78_05130 [Anaerolineales bacterium]|nr:hypothetical protein [Anaerolineales bacterium]HNN12918.1 hypothetical protein [Anaerolineales bacterium]HNO32437.1 hypothetical protein [Anaerolineales bacterium]